MSNPEKNAKNNGQLVVKYSAITGAYNATLKILDTDYENFAVLWSCSSVGSVGHTSKFIY